jgi:hypothetical protein
VVYVPNPQTPPPGPTGWYTDLSPFGTLPFVVDFTDPSGLLEIGCTGPAEFSYAPPVLLSTSFVYSTGVNFDGVHTLDCRATDVLGNTGLAPGSSAFPVVIRIDRTPPVVTCPADVRLRKSRTGSIIVATVTDATSGATQSRVAVRVDTSRRGTHQVSVTGADVAGNTATATCSYTVCAGFRCCTPHHRDRRGTPCDTRPPWWWPHR